jgi:uncharacterized protein (TIGR02145 family)
MKVKLPVLLLLCLVSMFVGAQNIPSYMPTNGLVGYWPFNGNANDESGNGNHGINYGATLTSDRNGILNSAVNFNGSGNYIATPNINHLNNSKNFTISLWQQITGNTLYSQFMVSRGWDQQTGHFHLMYHIDSNQYNAQINQNVNIGSGQLSIFSKKYGIPQTTWNHILMSYDGTVVKIYVNGVLDNSKLYDKYLSASTSPILFGKHQTIADYFYKGKLDDIGIWNRALTQSEITALYTGVPPCTPTSSTTNLTIPSTNLPYTWNGLTFNNNGSQTATLTNANGCDSSATLNLTVTNTIPSYLPTNGLIGYWPFNGNANDESGNGNHGTVNGATLTTDRNGNSGKAYSFDGISSYIEVLHNSIFNLTNSMSFSFWLNSNDVNQHQSIINKANPGVSDSWIVQLSPTQNDTKKIWLNCGGLNTISQMSNPSLETNNKWYHVLATYDMNVVKFYINGILDNIFTLNSPTPSNQNNIKIGGLLGEIFNGKLDDIAIYNRALTQQEVTQLYTGTVTYNINASSGTNGNITPSGSTTFNSGSSQTYTFTPNSGYWIDSIIVNGVQVPTASSYTFSNVNSNQSIRVTYRSLAAALAAANICSNDTIVATVNLPATTNVRAATYYSNIYLFNQNNTGNAYKYNVNDRKYTAIADKPTPCIECGVAEANGKIYCFNTNGTTQAYDIASNTWQPQTAQPSSSTSSVYAVSINNKVFVLGTNNNNQNTFTQYNPLNNTFTAQASPNQPTSQSRLVAYNNLIYKIGGINTSTNTTSTVVEVYNPSNNTWTNLPDLPEALSHVGATNYDNKLYVFGGKQSTASNSSNSNKVYVFDIAGNTWYAQGNTLNFQRANIEAKTANNLVYLFGGTDTSNTTNQAKRYFCKDQLCNCLWAEYVCNGVSSDNPCPTSSLYRPGTVFCNGYATKVVEVTNPITGKTWMDRNLGATRVATSSTDTLAYGDLYQWGRGADGHQCRNSTITSTLSSTDQPGHGNFILGPYSPYYNWRTSQNNNIWQGVNGVNNPCPTGYRLPTYTELEAERTSWSQNNAGGAFGSPLKLPMAGFRYHNDGSLFWVGSHGYYWSSTVDVNFVWFQYIYSGNALMGSNSRANGISVRCIKDYAAVVGTLDTIGSINQGVLYSGVAASNASTTLNYTGGNGAMYEAQTITSTGVTGLTANLAAGTLNNGNGTLTLNITGTPNSNGIASFSFTIGGKSIVFYREVKDSIFIGKYHQGGIIGYIFQPGDIGYINGQIHGIIVATIDQSSGSEFGCFGSLIQNTSPSIGTGLENTNKIVLACTESNIAAKLCYDLNLNGYSDWYLPSLSELGQLLNNQFILNTSFLANGGMVFSSTYYRTSTEVSSGNAFVYNFSNGLHYDNMPKSDSYHVRAIRSF